MRKNSKKSKNFLHYIFSFEGYTLLIDLLYIKEKIIIINAPKATGININSKDFEAITAIIGFPPAGG